MIAAQSALAGQTLRGMGETKTGRATTVEAQTACGGADGGAVRGSQGPPALPVEPPALPAEPPALPAEPPEPLAEPPALPAASKHGAFPLATVSDESATRPMLDRPAPIKLQSAGGSPAQPREQRSPNPHSASTIFRRSPNELLQSPAIASITRQQAVDGDPVLPSMDAGESIRCLSEAAMDCINSNSPASHLDGDHADALRASARSVRSQLNSGSSRPKCP